MLPELSIQDFLKNFHPSLWKNTESLRNFNYITIVIFSINMNCVILIYKFFVIDISVIFVFEQFYILFGLL